MSERFFRIILGSSLIILLYNQWDSYIYVYIGVLLFEGITNWRIPIIVTRLRYQGSSATTTSVLSPACEEFKINFDAERALRIVVALFLVFSFVLFHEQTWLFPWFIAFMLLSAGLSNICPMNMFLKWVGFK